MAVIEKIEMTYPKKEICLENNIQMIFGVGGAESTIKLKTYRTFFNTKEKSLGDITKISS